MNTVEHAVARPVYGSWRARSLLCALVLGAGLAGAQPKAPALNGDAVVVEAREAWGKKDRDRLAVARAAAVAANHPLAQWVEYFELNNRLADAQQDELTAFFSRWRGTYVEDRLRNDWLLELGKRNDWLNFAAEQPRFRMNDDREVTCYALMLEQRAGKDVHDAALENWLAQRDSDDGCALMATALLEARQFTPADVWRKLRIAIDATRHRAARQAATLLGPSTAGNVNELIENPIRYLARKASAGTSGEAELATLALIRLAGTDPVAAATQLNDRWEKALPGEMAVWAWAVAAKQAAMRLLPEAPDYYQRVTLRAASAGSAAELTDDMLAWKARAALRADDGRGRWQQVMQAINAMSMDEQGDPAWIYWKARALQALARDSQDGASLRAMATEMMGSIAGQFHFYGKLAAENLGPTPTLPPRPAPLTPQEREAAATHPGLKRALHLIALDLRSEGVREWNYARRGMAERDLLAAAQLACDREVWDRCISTSERTVAEVDMKQRFPTPMRNELEAAASEIGLDPAFVYGLIRQESRFVMNARSSVGASGLMQLMPATARWTARKIGLKYSRELITDREVNLKLGTTYLKLMLDDFSNSTAMAVAAYNAGPGRPRRWREGPELEPAAWVENIPFTETREYVKKVLSNTAYYAAMMNGQRPSLKAQLGRAIGPRPDSERPPDKELP
jgi:soluble lytic murein transglycosylase